MLVYEVNLEVDDSVAQAYADYLPGHIQEVIRAGRFKSAQWFKRFQPPKEKANDLGEDDKTLWTIFYHIESQELLDKYLSEQAPRLRAEALSKFGDRFKASRRILELKNEFTD